MTIPVDLQIPSPLHLLPLKEAQEAGIALYIKRDDLIHPLVSGNKWRKLEGFVRDAQANGAESLVSFGGYYSNHILALAVAGALLGWTTEGYIRGEPPPEDGMILRLCRLLGMQLYFMPRTAFTGVKRAKYGYDKGDNKYYIPEGGYGINGLSGLAAIREEIPFVPDHIITAVGTGTTLAGLAAEYIGTQTMIEGIVVLKGMDSLDNEIKALLEGFSGYSYTLHHRFHHGGYARTTPELNSFIQSFISATGILIDPVYTAKMMYATRELILSGHFKKGSKVVCLHTGGIVGGLSLLNTFNFK